MYDLTKGVLCSNGLEPHQYLSKLKILAIIMLLILTQRRCSVALRSEAPRRSGAARSPFSRSRPSIAPPAPGAGWLPNRAKVLGNYRYSQHKNRGENHMLICCHACKVFIWGHHIIVVDLQNCKVSTKLGMLCSFLCRTILTPCNTWRKNTHKDDGSYNPE